MTTKIKSAKAAKFSPLKKKIILAQSAAADGDPAVAIAAIDEALSQFKPRLEIRKLLEKARDEFDIGTPATGETLLDMAFSESRGELEKPLPERGGKSVQVASVISCAADTLDAFQCEDADFYRAEFAKIEALQKDLLAALENASAAWDKSDLGEEIDIGEIRAVISRARGKINQ